MKLPEYHFFVKYMYVFQSLYIVRSVDNDYTERLTPIVHVV